MGVDVIQYGWVIIHFRFQPFHASDLFLSLLLVNNLHCMISGLVLLGSGKFSMDGLVGGMKITLV